MLNFIVTNHWWQKYQNREKKSRIPQKNKLLGCARKERTDWTFWRRKRPVLFQKSSYTKEQKRNFSSRISKGFPFDLPIPQSLYSRPWNAGNIQHLHQKRFRYRSKNRRLGLRFWNKRIYRATFLRKIKDCKNDYKGR